MTATCRGEHCQARIDFATKPDGTGRLALTRPGPCPGPGLRCTHEGNLAVWRNGPALHYRFLSDGELPGPREHRGISHHAECPDAGQFRNCRKCKHNPHPAGPCAKLGPVTCRQAGTALIRGRFPCGCTEGVTADADRT